MHKFVEMGAKLKLSIGEQIDRSKDGRSQTFIVNKMVEAGIDIDEVRFSRKKKGHETFTEKEIEFLEDFLSVKFEE